MDAFDILGSLLGKKASRKGSGGSILKDVLSRKSAPPPREPAPAERSRPQRRPLDEPPGGGLSLDDLLRRASDQYTRHTGERMPGIEMDSSPSVRLDSPRRTPPRQQLPPAPPTAPRSEPRANEDATANEQARILIRAIIQASRADGQIDDNEQDAILQQFGTHLTQQQADFLRMEFRREESVRDFCWSVPLGLEEHVYATSVMSIDLDENSEAKYLQELAHGLRLRPEVCNQIHDRYRAPRIFR